MYRLPQDSLSPNRADELAEQRAQYVWDHEYFAPYPFLHIPDIDHTGPLHVADILVGSFAGLPQAEHPPTDFVIEKTLASIPALYELLARVPMTEWLKLGATFNVQVSRKANGWIDDAIETLVAEISDQDGTSLPDLDALATLALDLLVKIVGELSVAIDTNRSALGRVIGFISSLLGKGSHVEAETAGEAAQRVLDAGLPDSLARLILPLQTLLRFTATMQTYGLIEPAAEPNLRKLLKVLPLPATPDPTADDAAFGRLPVAGPNPVMLTRLHSPADIPAAFPVTDNHLRAALGAIGLSDADLSDIALASAAAEGRLFLVDYSLLDNTPCRSGVDTDFFGQPLGEETARQRYLPAPFGLFYRLGDGAASALHPVAIQLGQDSDQFEIFTPAEDPEVWAKAKMLYLTGEFNYHEMVTHLSSVHFILEAFAVAAGQHLHPEHPVGAFFKVHLDILLWNNFLGRQTLTNKVGFTEQLLAGELEEGSYELMRRHYRQWSFADFDLPADLKRRGVDDAEVLPCYPFRDDGLKMWAALERYVTRFVGVYYTCDDDVLRDHELQGFVDELRSETGGHVAGLEPVKTPADVATLLLRVAFRAGPFHSGVNYGQFDHFSYPIRSPGAPCADPRDLRTTDRRDYLPSGEVALTQANVMFVLAGFRGETYTDLDLSDYDDPRLWPVVTDLRVTLDQIEADIKLQNNTTRADAPYTYLQPSLVTLSSNV